MEERLLSVERRLMALLNILPKEWQEKVEAEKRRMMQEDGTDYFCEYTIETDKSTKDIQLTVRAWSEQQALFFGWEETIYPNLRRLQENGTIRWFKRNKMKILNLDNSK